MIQHAVLELSLPSIIQLISEEIFQNILRNQMTRHTASLQDGQFQSQIKLHDPTKRMNWQNSSSYKNGIGLDFLGFDCTLSELHHYIPPFRALSQTIAK